MFSLCSSGKRRRFEERDTSNRPTCGSHGKVIESSFGSRREFEEREERRVGRPNSLVKCDVLFKETGEIQKFSKGMEVTGKGGMERTTTDKKEILCDIEKIL